ncbi:MAG: hypothetical protein WKG01_14570 [Kofleriaceae bacterium]
MVRLRRSLRDLSLVLAAGCAGACKATPSEMPPLAPRPEPTEPSSDPSPVPGVPDPIEPSSPGPAMPGGSGAPAVPPGPAFIDHRPPAPTPPVRTDAGIADGGIVLDARPDASSPLPPLPDGGLPPDGPLQRQPSPPR